MAVGEGYRGEDYPVEVGGTFIKRVQSIDIQKNVPVISHYELGNSVPIGGVEDTRTYTGRITWLPIDNQHEAAWLGVVDITNAVPKGLKDFIDATAVDVETPVDKVTGCFATGLDYSLRVGGDFVGNLSFEGEGWEAGVGTAAVAPSGRGAYRAPEVYVYLGGTLAARAQGFSIRAALQVDRLMELGAVDPVEIKSSRPNTSCSIDWVESPNMAPLKANLEPGVTSGGVDIQIRIGSTTIGKRLTVTNAVFSGLGPRGFINGYAVRRYDYVSVGDNTYGGLKIDKTS